MKGKRMGHGWRTMGAAGAFLLAGGLLSVAEAEERNRAGLISMTIHKEDVGPDSSQYFYVTKDRNRTRWRNYKEGGKSELRKGNFVFEVKETSVPPVRRSPPEERAEAAAARENPF